MGRLHSGQLPQREGKRGDREGRMGRMSMGRRAAAGPDHRFREIDDSGGPKGYPCHRVVEAKGNEGKNGRARACLIPRDIEPRLVLRAQRGRGRGDRVHEATYFRVRLHDQRLRVSTALTLAIAAETERERRSGSDLSEESRLEGPSNECSHSRNSLNIFPLFRRPLLEVLFFLSHFLPVRRSIH